MNKKTRGALAVVAALLAQSNSYAYSINDVWVGSSTGNWSNPLNWLSNTVPNNDPNHTYNPTISNASVGFDLPSANIGSLTLNSAGLAVIQGSNLTLTGDLNGVGTVNVYNSASLTVGGVVNGAVALNGDHGGLAFLNAANISSTGAVLMDATQGGAAILASVGGNSAVTNGGTIQGAGYLLSMSSLANQGVIAAEASSGDGKLYIQPTSFNNLGGRVEALAGSSVFIQTPNFVTFQNNNLNGGAFLAAGVLDVGGAVNTIGGSSDVQLSGNGSLRNGAIGALDNLGLIQGTLNVSNHANQMFGALTLANSGRIFVDFNSLATTSGTLQNQSSGYLGVDAGSTFRAPGGGFNAGTFQANGTIDLRGGALDSFTNLSSADETLRGGTYDIGPNGLFAYAAGSGAHGGAIVHIGSNTTVDLEGGQIEYGTGNNALAPLASNDGVLTVGANNPSGYTFQPDGGAFINSGTLSIGPSSAATFLGAGTNAGGLTIDRGIADFTAGFSQSIGTTTLMNGWLATPSASINGGTVTGTGLISGDTTVSGGVVNPDGGVIEIGGNYTQGPGGTLRETLGSGSYLSVDGNLALSGMFDGLLTPGAAPMLGDVFEVAKYQGSLTGNFSSLNLPQLGSGLAFQEVVGAHDITLDIVAAPEPSFFWIAGAMLLGAFTMRRRIRAQA